MLNTLPDPEKAERSADAHAAADLSIVESTPESNADGGASDGEDAFGLEDVEDNESVRSRNGHRGAKLARFSTMDSLLWHPSRPTIPRWLLWLKDVFFAAHDRHSDVPTYRYLPFVSGALIPFSILLEIPGITERWYVRKENGVVVESRNNTTLLNAFLGLSLASACVANATLLLRFFERRVAAMTILCLVFLTVHDTINVVVVITFGVEHRFNDGFTYGESYWLTVCSTVVSLITNGTLIWDLWRTPNFAKSGSGLTRKQRSLIIINIIFLTYIALGALAFRYLIGLTFIDSLYFTVVTNLTIGFGDIDATTAAQRSVVCLYSAFGIVILGAAIRLIGETVVEALEIGYRRRVRDVRKHRHERQRHVREAARWRNAVETRLKAKGVEIWVDTDEHISVDGLPRNVAPAAHPLHHGRNPLRPDVDKPMPKVFRKGSGHSALPPHDPDTEDRLRPPPRAGMVLNAAALDMAELAAAAREARVPIERFAPEALQHTQSAGRKAREPGAGAPRGANWWGNTYHWLLAAKGAHPEDEHAQIGKVYVDTVRALEVDERKSLYVKLGVAWTTFFIFWMTGSLIFWHVEGWTYGNAMYFCFVTFTTVGYGDVTPVTALGRSIFIFWALMGVGSMTVLIAVISDAFSSKYRSVTHSKTFDRAIENYRAGRPSHSKGAVPSPESNPGTPSNDMREHIPNQLKKDLDRLAAPEGFVLRRRTAVQGDEEHEKQTQQVSEPNRPAEHSESVEHHDFAKSQSDNPRRHPSSRSAHNQPHHYPTLASALHPQHEAHTRSTDSHSPTHQRHAELTTRLRSRFEALPPSILEEAHTLREQIRYFLTSNGHAHGLDDTAPTEDDKVPRSLRDLFDEISKDDPGDGHELGERMKEEIWEDDYSRNTLFVLGFEKSIRKLVDAAEGALEVLAERDRLLAENQAQRTKRSHPDSPKGAHESEITDHSPTHPTDKQN
ncbi:hypothetical protein PENSPDRAFT_747462 [Peniophora sp. CONT]|nr:hypothetical protein PENSPDRAFT_747462 [Peniophora sp. CONT]